MEAVAMSERVPDQVLERLLIQMDEQDRLRSLTNRQLVEDYRCCESELAIQEMMYRLDPHWPEREIGH